MCAYVRPWSGRRAAVASSGCPRNVAGSRAYWRPLVKPCLSCYWCPLVTMCWIGYCQQRCAPVDKQENRVTYGTVVLLLEITHHEFQVGI